MERTAWLFPGQGAQYPGVGRGFAFDHPLVRPVFEEAEAACDQSLRELAVEGSAEQLRNPAVLEPLLVAFSLAYIALLRNRGSHPAAVAGYSAGAISALYCAGVINRTAAFTIAAQRGQLLARSAPSCRGTMAAVFDLPAPKLLQVMSDVMGDAPVEIAGWNAPDHITVVGADRSITRAIEAVREAGGQVFPVDVAAAWHSRVAEPIASECHALLERLVFSVPEVPFYCSVAGRRESDPERLRALLAEQIHRPVMWQAAIGNLRASEGITDFIEVGCGRSLKGFTQRNPSRPIGVGSARNIVFTNLYNHLEQQHA